MHLLTLLSSVFTRGAHNEQAPALEARSRQAPAPDSDAQAERLLAEILSTRKVTAEDRKRYADVAQRILHGMWAAKLASGELSCSFASFAREAR